MSFIEQFPQFTRSERRGVVVLVAIMAVMVLYIFFSKSFVPNGTFTKSDFEDLQSNFYAPEELHTAHSNDSTDKRHTFNLQPFNPNNLDAEGWEALGLSSKQANSVLNYKEKIGGFKNSGQLEKAYAISDELFDRIHLYLQFDNKIAVRKSKTVVCELNSASKESLEGIRGIGPATAKGIIAVRNKLGGYLNHNQLKFVYNMSEERLETIKPFLKIDSTKITQINVNEFEPGQLFKHPYVQDWDIVNQINNERDNFGAYLDFADFRSRMNFSDDFYLKMKPYLKFQNGPEQ